ncbi:M50 family metallopeptidase [Anaerospora hongkongensis]|uniref:M50 family metallopeptidase n=1 Tax=Anaerospora hongkongensis TaxID=244830 RepID=UPI0028966634|nr:M50 family metallopeptidase [Anaerospora hongkongensis]
MHTGKVAGTQIILNNWFLVLLGLFALAGMLGKVLIVFGAIICHELAHAGTAHLLGFKVREIELLPFGGVARIDRLNEAAPVQDMLIAAAGPLCSLVLAAITHLMMTKFAYRHEEWFFFLQVNIMLACFNLLPALPLDGGRIFRAWLCRVLDYGRATQIVVTVSKGISLGLLGYSLADFGLSGTVNVTFIAAGIFLFASARAETQIAGFRTMRVLAHKKELLTAKGIMSTAHFTAVSSMPIKEVMKHFHPEQYYIVIVVDESLAVQGQVTETELWEVLTKKGISATLFDILQ